MEKHNIQNNSPVNIEGENYKDELANLIIQEKIEQAQKSIEQKYREMSQSSDRHYDSYNATKFLTSMDLKKIAYLVRRTYESYSGVGRDQDYTGLVISDVDNPNNDRYIINLYKTLDSLCDKNVNQRMMAEDIDTIISFDEKELTYQLKNGVLKTIELP